jgi:hypothetical protein
MYSRKLWLIDEEQESVEMRQWAHSVAEEWAELLDIEFAEQWIRAQARNLADRAAAIRYRARLAIVDARREARAEFEASFGSKWQELMASRKEAPDA